MLREDNLINQKLEELIELLNIDELMDEDEDEVVEEEEEEEEEEFEEYDEDED